MNPSPPRERNSPDWPPQAGVGSPFPDEELTRGGRDTQSAGRLCEYAMAWTDGTQTGHASRGSKPSRPPLQGPYGLDNWIPPIIITGVGKGLVCSP